MPTMTAIYVTLAIGAYGIVGVLFGKLCSNDYPIVAAIIALLPMSRVAYLIHVALLAPIPFWIICAGGCAIYLLVLIPLAADTLQQM